MTMTRAMALVGFLSLVLVSEAQGQQGTEQEPADTTTAQEDTLNGGAYDWLGRLQVLGTLEGEFRRSGHSGFPGSNAGSATDLYLRRLEIAVDGKLSDLAEAVFVLNTENLGDPAGGGDGTMVLDEGHLDLAGHDTEPLYLIVGLQTQPFGLFESHSVTDPMTQDAYEIKRVGVVLGVLGPKESDLSLTAYKGGELMAHLFGSRLFDAGALARVPGETNSVDSYILSGKVTPIDDHLDLFGSLVSEPGNGRRNVTYDMGLTLAVPRSQHFLLDTEYAKALQRESYPALPAREFKEGVFSSSLSYQFIVRERETKGTNLKARRSRIASHPVELSARFEHFDDGGITSALRAWSIRNRVSLGGRYTIEDEGGGSLYFLAEYRRSSLRLPPGDTEELLRESNGELYMRIGIIF